MNAPRHAREPAGPRSKPLRLAPPQFVPLDEERRARAVAALADLIARQLPRTERDREAIREADGDGESTVG